MSKKDPALTARYNKLPADVRLVVTEEEYGVLVPAKEGGDEHMVEEDENPDEVTENILPPTTLFG